MTGYPMKRRRSITNTLLSCSRNPRRDSFQRFGGSAAHFFIFVRGGTLQSWHGRCSFAANSAESFCSIVTMIGIGARERGRELRQRHDRGFSDVRQRFEQEVLCLRLG